MEISPLQPAVKVEISVLVAPQIVDALSNALKDVVYEHEFYEAKLRQDGTTYNLSPHKG